jgi:Fur family transcriptional regulator, ferric uptake regulator
MAKPLSSEEIQAAETIFREYLREHGLKYTPERHALLRQVLADDEHFEAEQLLMEIRQGVFRVAKATVYRTLPLLVNCGIIRQVQFGDQFTEKHAHYEHTFAHEPHDHMVCRRCGKIIEFDSKEILRLRDALSEQFGFQPTSHRLQISGFCADCRG